MRKFIVTAKIQYSVDGVITTLGAASGAYFADAAGLLNKTWYPILDAGVSVGIDLALPWDDGSPSQSIGDIVLINGGDSEFEHVLDQLIQAQVAGLESEVRRGFDDQAWDELEVVFVAKNDGKRFDGESLILPQRSRLDVIEQPIATTVFDETTPNPRIVNRSVPLLLGSAFQIEPLIWDAPNQIYFTASNLGNVRDVFEGGNLTTNWQPVQFGHQMTAGSNLTITVDAVGPPPETASSVNRVDWAFDAWTSGDPDGISVTEVTGEATISENTSGEQGDLSIVGTPTGDTGFVSFTAPFLFAAWGTATTNWTAATGTVPDAIIADGGDPAEVSTWSQEPLAIIGIDPAMPADSVVAGVELEVIAEGTNARFEQLSVIDSNGFQISAFAGVSGSGDFLVRNIPATKTTMTGGSATFKTSATEFATARVNAGIGVFLSVSQQSPGTVATAKIHQIRIKLHYVSAIPTVRLESTSAVITAGRRYRVNITHTAADIWARWGAVGTAGDVITAPDDPFSQWFANFASSGQLEFEFVADKSGLFAFEYFRSTSAGTGEVDQITVDEITDGISTYPGLVAYMATLKEISASVDTAAIAAHDTAVGSPDLGWYVTGNESMAEIMDLFARSLSGAWWPDRDGQLRSMLWSLDPTAVPDFRIENIEVDGIPRPIRVQGNITVQNDPAPRVTERAVGARNWRPLRVSETAGITDTFTEQERANVIEDWRVRRRANFDSLNPWPVV